MIELITGLPGNGKTLYVISYLKAKSEAESRPVFYHGINELKLPWLVVDPLKWWEVPANAIVVIDEAQEVFRARSMGSVPPEHVTRLEKHRHLGIDLVLMTQHPSLIDSSIRRLCETHKHLIRMFGMQMSTIHQWQGVRDNCDKPPGRRDSNKTKWVFDKAAYGLYKSAEVHTMKRSIPFRVKMLFAIPFVLAGAAYAVYALTIGKHPPPVVGPAPGQLAQARPGGVVGPQSALAPAKAFDPVEDAKHYVEMSTPRVAGLEHTAPKYDELTKPSRVPVPAMCIEFRGTCQCKTQQATPMDVPEGMCRSFARNGFFEDFDPEKDRKDSARTAQSLRVMDGHDSVPPASAVQRQAAFEVSDAPVGTVAFSTVPDLPRTTNTNGKSKPAQAAPNAVPST